MAEQPTRRASKTFRLPDDTSKALDRLATFFNESQADVIIRAVNLLDQNKELEVKREYEQRLKQIKKQ